MNLYDSLEAELHDAFWDAEESPELEWLDTLLARDPGPALEVGSGSGRLLLPLLENGHEIEGLEPAAAMRALCRERATACGLDPRIHPADVAGFRAGTRFAAVLVPAFTLQLCREPEADLARMIEWLAPGGRLYLTVFLPFAELDGELPENEWYPDHELTLPDGRRASVHTRHRLDRGARILEREHHYRLAAPGQPTREHRSRQTIRWFDAARLRDLLGKHDLAIDHAVGDFDDGQPITEASQILTVVARRPK